MNMVTAYPFYVTIFDFSSKLYAFLVELSVVNESVDFSNPYPYNINDN